MLSVMVILTIAPDTILILQDREVIADDAQLIQFIVDDARSKLPP